MIVPSNEASVSAREPGPAPCIESLSAVTLSTGDMARAVAFYLAMGFELKHGGAGQSFSTFRCGASCLNLTVESQGAVRWWGRVIFHVSDVDAFYRRALAAGFSPSSAPSDAPWGERYFHLTDHDGHELSFAKVL
ncbi:MAG: VOC family protein [Burkholderiaceae bacterium]